ncbi:MAG: hypothetical protein AAFN27_20020 [Pseudomonadota bacterium]
MPWCQLHSISKPYAFVIRRSDDLTVLHARFICHYYPTMADRLDPGFTRTQLGHAALHTL